MVEPGTPAFQWVREGTLQLLSPQEVLAETCLLLQHARPSKPCVFRSNHASNYVSLRGNLPMDNESMILSLKKCMEDRGLLKDERFRML